jgi:hypothetical protein
VALGDQFVMSLKRALTGLQDHPLRVHDVKSAMEVKGIGGAIAKTAAEDLWAAYPAEPPSAEEAAQLERARAAIRADDAAKRKRKADADAAAKTAASASARARTSGDLPPPPPAATAARRATDPPASAAAAAAAAAPEAAATGRARPRAPRAPKDYCPQIGTANFAFLLTLLHAQRGPERLDHLVKQALIDRAESSGLADKPIHGDAPPAPAQGFGGAPASSRGWYSGWSSFKKLQNEGLAFAYSNPKKVQLTPAGLALAERLYRDAVARGRAAPVPGIPVEGAMRFQLEAAQQPGDAGEGSAGAAVTAAAGLPAAALPSAALRPGAAARRGAAPVAAPAPADPRAAAAAAAERRRSVASGGASPDDDELELAQRLAQRLARQQQPRRRRAAPLFDPPPGRQAPQADGAEVIDLASSDEEQGSERGLVQVPWGPGGGGDTSGPSQQAAAAGGGARDESVAQMVEMGYSAGRARRVSARQLAARIHTAATVRPSPFI